MRRFDETESRSHHNVRLLGVMCAPTIIWPARHGPAKIPWGNPTKKTARWSVLTSALCSALSAAGLIPPRRPAAGWACHLSCLSEHRFAMSASLKQILRRAFRQRRRILVFARIPGFSPPAGLRRRGCKDQPYKLHLTDFVGFWSQNIRKSDLINRVT